MTRLERKHRILISLATEVMPDQRIRFRDHQYWLGSIQLTYESDNRDGHSRLLGAADSAANQELAESILRRCLAARQQPTWGTRWERLRRLLVGLHDDVLPGAQRGCFCHWPHDSGDDGCVYQCGAGPWTADAHLFGVGKAGGSGGKQVV